MESVRLENTIVPFSKATDELAKLPRRVLFNPALPWIYLPQLDFEEFAAKVSSLYKFYDLKCDLNWGECRFKKSCLEVREMVDDLSSFEMSFDVKDSGATFYD